MGSETSREAPQRERLGDVNDEELCFMINDTVYDQFSQIQAGSIEEQRLALREAMSKKNLTLNEKFDTGDFGEVFTGLHKGVQATVKFRRFNEMKEKRNFVTEMSSLKKLKKNPYVVKLMECFHVDKIIVFVYDYHDCNLHEFIQASEDGLTEPEAARFYLQIGNGLAAAHDERIVHKGLKPQNILLDASRTIAKLSGFQQSEFCYEFHTGKAVKEITLSGTPAYWPWECLVLEEEKLKEVDSWFKIDIWGMGVIMFEMVYGKPPWIYNPQNNKEEYIEKLKNPIISAEWMSKQTSRDFMNFVLRHFAQPKERPMMNQLLLDPFLIKGMNHSPNKIEFPPDNTVQNQNPQLANDLSPELLRDFDHHGYQIMRKLGNGNYGNVYGGKFRGQLCATKILGLEEDHSGVVNDQYVWFGYILSEDMIDEMTFLKKLNHPNIIQIIHVFHVVGPDRQPGQFVITTELAGGGNLSSYIATKNGLSEAEAARFYLQIGSGLQHVHSIGLAHKDLKPDNILLDETRTVCKLADFGVTTHVYNQQSGQLEERFNPHGTFGFKPPEYYRTPKNVLYQRGQAYNETLADIWPMGTIMFMMIYRVFPFPWSELWTFEDQVRRILKKMENPSKKVSWQRRANVSNEFKKFVCEHWQWEAEDRPPIDKLLAHPYLRIAHSFPLVASTRRPVLRLEDFPSND